MKRILWCLCLCLLSAIALTACGDDEDNGGTADGGVTPNDLEEVNDRLDGINSTITGLGQNIGELGTQLGDLEDSLSELGNELGGRLDALENPDILSCSEQERCIPDGLSLATTAIADIIELVCSNEVDCCSAAELNLKFGPAVESAEDCVALFTDIVNNGLSPNFIGGQGYVVNQVISIAQALNDPAVRVELNPEGIAACVASLEEFECPSVSEVEPTEPQCQPYTQGGMDPCSLGNLVRGLQEEGELCGEYARNWYSGALPECEEGLYCSFAGVVSGNRGICARVPEEGDGCQRDLDCDPSHDEGQSYMPSTNLYCNLQTAQCQPLGDVGDDCALIDPDFIFGLNPANNNSLSQDCMPGLTCDPRTNTCVARCDDGAYCAPFGSYQCADGLVCNVTEFGNLFDFWPNLGVCSEPIEQDEKCTLSDECAGGPCAYDIDEDDYFCGQPYIAPGDACSIDEDDAPGPDSVCETGHCDENAECALPCDCDETVDESGIACADLLAENPGADPDTCPNTHFCNFANTFSEGQQTRYTCSVRIPNGQPCLLNGYADRHESCASGFCNPDPGNDQTEPFNVCSPKETDTTDGPCPSGLSQECPNNQYCNSALICKPYVGVGGNCDLTASPALQCRPDLVCVDGVASDTCRALAQSGEACSFDNLNAPPCAAGLNCIDIDGSGPGTDRECYSFQAGFANGVECFFADSYCVSGWCRPNGPITPTASACADPLEEGDDCDVNDQTLDVCGPGLYCNHPFGNGPDDGQGRCARQRGPGQSCRPYFNNRDCAGSGDCILTKDRFQCDWDSLTGDNLFCDGN